MDSFLVIGLGSMGKRRIRNLQALNKSQIFGFDLRIDRCKETSTLYAIETFNSFELAVSKIKVDALIISVPPDIHHFYIQKAIQLNLPAFIEASVVDTEFNTIIDSAKTNNVFLAPSCTLFFHPAVKLIAEQIRNQELGKISNIIYHSGQYLPDWHTYEKVSEFYVSKKETGGCREIVPFELSWITLLMGFPSRLAAFFKKTVNIEGAPEIDDTYNILLDYDSYIFNLIVDVVSRSATRRLLINGDKKQLVWNWEDGNIQIFDPTANQWAIIAYTTSSSQSGYNKNLTEQMYIDEINAFIKAATGQGSFPNDMEHDHKVLKILYTAEQSDIEGRIITL